MASTPPPASSYAIPPIPYLPPPSGGHRPRGSFGSSFSLGPQSMMDSYIEGHASPLSQRSFNLDPNQSMLSASPLRSSPRRKHRAPRETAGRGPHPLATDTTDIFQDSEIGADADDEDEQEWGMVDRIRLWRHDALMQHMYETAAFWGDKVLSWTNDPNDAFWLAQTYFNARQYSRAARLLTRPFRMGPPHRSPSPPHPSANGFMSAKGKERETGEKPIVFPARLPMGPAGMITMPEEEQEGVSRLVDMSLSCRYLAGMCQMQMGHWSEALEIIGESNPFQKTSNRGPAVPNNDGGIKVEASTCYLRGLLMQKLNRGDEAKESFLEALSLDVKCYDAFQKLVDSQMMTPDEEWNVIQSLAYSSQTPHDAQFVQLMYTSRLRKYKHKVEHALTRKKLVEEYSLGDNPDVLLSFADALFSDFRFADCYTITSRVLGMISIHNQALPMHLACMFELKHLHSKLFLLAHEMVDREPDNALSWYAVGMWYLSKGSWGQARQFFAKSSLLDPRFAPAWISFAHAFSFEGEHDHAITAYSTCTRMFNGSHLPYMFLGMEHLALCNYGQANDAFRASRSLCDSDPLLLNELGVLAYQRQKYKEAAKYFEQALDVANVTQSSHTTWQATYINMGTCYRKLRRLPKAVESYEKVLESDPRHAVALSFLAICYHLMGDLDSAILKYHETLSLVHNNNILDLLNLALDAATVVDQPRLGDAEWRQRVAEWKAATGQIQPQEDSTVDEMSIG
ncbi:hypothetical protein EV714DRAFT_246059 [Schizophyllum commune]